MKISRGDDQSLHVSGDVVYATVPELFEAGRKALAEERDAVVDLAGVTRVDSSALALMLEWVSVCQAGGRQVRFRNVPPNVMAIADLSNAKGLLPLVGS